MRRRAAAHRHVDLRLLFTIAAVLGLNACGMDQPVTPAAPETAVDALGAAGQELPAHVPDGVRPGEARFRALARQVPGFGGFYFDESGQLVVLATELERGPALRAALIPILNQLATERGRAGARLPEIVVRKSEYGFADLSRWREQIQGPLFALEPVMLIDLDERENRLFVGLSDESGRPDAEAALRRMRVPLEAVRLAVVGVPAPLVGSASASTNSTSSGCLHLQQYCRPLIGGMQIEFLHDNSFPTCTVGFTAEQAGQPYFVTAAHCSVSEWGLDGTSYYQPYHSTSTPYGAGNEVRDPRGWSCDFLYTWKCRYSDANLVQPSIPVEVGYIARPHQLQSLTVSVNQPRFTVVGQSDAYVGERVYAVGRSTGLHTGTVQKTCTDYKKTWDGRFHKVVCTDVSDHNSTGGDSGGPIFLWNGTSDYVTIVGVNFARIGVYDHAFYSPFSGIQRDLGSLEARAPEYRGSTGGGGGGEPLPSCPTCKVIY